MIVTGGHLQVPACCLSAAGNAVSGKGRQRIMTETKDYVRKVQYYETDRMGIVHHSNYIRWMEEAFEKQDFAYWEKAFKENDIPFQKCFTMNDILNDQEL